MPEANGLPTPASPAPPKPCCDAFDLSTTEGLQRGLKALGYWVTVDVVDGRETERAVKAFQAHDGDPFVDGYAGAQTKAALCKALACRRDAAA